MKVNAGIFLGLLCAVSASMGQSNSRAGNDVVLPLPKTQCRYDPAYSVVMRVKESAPLDFSASLEKPIRFPVGTLVSVSRRERSWSCVTGSIQTSTGRSTRTGWMQSSQLEEISSRSAGR